MNLSQHADVLSTLSNEEWIATVQASIHITPFVKTFRATVSYCFVMRESNQYGTLILSREISRDHANIDTAVLLAVEEARKSYAADLLRSQRAAA